MFSEKNIPIHQDIPLGKDGKIIRSRKLIVYDSYLQAIPFHKEKENLSVSPEKQLEIILRNSTSDTSDEILE